MIVREANSYFLLGSEAWSVGLMPSTVTLVKMGGEGIDLYVCRDVDRGHCCCFPKVTLSNYLLNSYVYTHG